MVAYVYNPSTGKIVAEGRESPSEQATHLREKPRKGADRLVKNQELWGVAQEYLTHLACMRLVFNIQHQQKNNWNEIKGTASSLCGWNRVNERKMVRDEADDSERERWAGQRCSQGSGLATVR